MNFSNQHKIQAKQLKKRESPELICLGQSEASTQDELNFQKGFGTKGNTLTIKVINNKKSFQIETKYLMNFVSLTIKLLQEGVTDQKQMVKTLAKLK